MQKIREALTVCMRRAAQAAEQESESELAR